MIAGNVLEMVGSFALIGALAKAGLVVACAGLVTVPLRRASAATRQGVWTGAFVLLALLPVGGMLLPHWTMEVPVGGGLFPEWTSALSVAAGPQVPVAAASSGPVARAGHEANARWDGDARSLAAPSATQDRSAVDGQSPGPIGPLRSPLAVIGLLYLIGCGVLLARLALHTFRASRMARRGTRPAGSLAHLVDGFKRDGLLPARVRVLLCDRVSGPLTFGVLRPVVILPLSARRWPADQVRVALLHEGAHVRRGDALVHLFVRLVGAFYWHNPLVRLAAARQRAEQERACDDRAIVAGVASHTYAHHLVRVAREGLARPLVPAASLSIAGGGLRERIAAIMDGATDRRPMSRTRVGAALVVLLALIVPAAALDLRGASATPEPASPPVAETRDHDDQDPGPRARDAWLLGERQHPDGVNTLLDALRDVHPTVRAVSAWALGEIKDARAVAALGDVLTSDDDPAVRELAALALGEIGADDAAPALNVAFAADPAVRSEAAWALDRLGRRADERADGIEPWLDLDVLPPPFGAGAPLAAVDARLVLASADPSGRALAAWSLGLAADTADVDALIQHLRDPDPIVRATVVWALDEINPSRN